jgi:hypothetical protein
MKKVDKPTATIRSVRKYNAFKKATIDLIQAVQSLQPGGTIISDIAFVKDEDNTVSIQYKVQPIRLVIKDDQTHIIVTVLQDSGQDKQTEQVSLLDAS